MRINIFFLLFFLSSHLFSQNFSVSIGSGIATYSMKSLKNFDQSIVATDFMGLKPSLTDNFPPYVYYHGEASYTNNKTIYGISITHGSTGSRTTYGDYSGKIFRDNLVRYNAIGLRLGQVFVSKKNFIISANARASGIFNRLRVKERLDIAGSSIENSTRYHSLNFGLMPFFSGEYIFNKIFISFDIGYEYQITGRLFVNNEDKLYIVDQNNNEIYIDGRGVRAIVNLGYRFNKK